MLLPGFAQLIDELLRVVDVQSEPVPAVALGHRAAERRRGPSAVIGVPSP